ncbi:MAG: enoyl-CoA hydratase/isomerase family protein [Rhodospirillales bacterium]|nr:enoyl-CoA hydratase/isomerase family protein [Rhodospirillales bacterium]QQS11484.1 MAG: enoyl-CoA hydratase/isomerase family protein [Rhodospirillales bacterium]
MATTAREIDTGTTQLLCAVREGVATITLNRPEARNTMSTELTPALRRMIKEMGEDDSVGAIVVTGAGKAFCAGGDVKGMGENRRTTMTPEERVVDLKWRQQALTGALLAVPKPTIAALPGPAVGAGFALALAADVRIAARSAFVGTGYARVGLSGDYGIAWLLTRQVGTGKARELMFTNARVEAAEAERLGIVNRVVDDAALADAAFAMARDMAAGPRIALRSMKENLDLAERAGYVEAADREAELMIAGSQTEDHKEAVRAFVEKRAPVFAGR